MLPVQILHISGLEINQNEVFRYAGCKTPTDTAYEMLDRCLMKAESLLKADLCYTTFDVSAEPDRVITPFTVIHSEKLTKHWQDCTECVLFAATLGVDFDRLNKKTALVSPADGLMMNALGTALIEEACDRFNESIRQRAKNENKTCVSRFSPGYGDLSLSLQTDIFNILEPQKHIGLALNSNLFMTPVKSVTALIGMKPNLN